jgi:hypothetical protein
MIKMLRVVAQRAHFSDNRELQNNVTNRDARKPSGCLEPQTKRLRYHTHETSGAEQQLAEGLV